MDNFLWPLLLALVAPVFYGLLGAAVLGGAGRAGRVWLVPLAGGVAAGALGEVALATGWSLPVVWGAVAAVGLARLLLGGAAGWRGPTAAFGLLYAGALVALSLDPYPGMFLWGGDWLETLGMAGAVLDGTLPPELLSRPPLYGGTTAPALLVGGGLPGAQIVSAYVAAAGTLAVGPVLLRASSGRRAAWGVLLAVASPFFLLHAINLWSKLLAAGCVVAALRAGWEGAGRPGWRAFVPAALWLGAGIAVHQSSVLFAPLLLAVAGRRDPASGRGWYPLAGRTLVLALAGLAMAGPFEAWVLAHHGLAAVAAGNPSVTFRDGTPFWLNTVLVGVSTLTGWFPVAIAARARLGTGGAALGFLAVAGWVVSLAGTVVGVGLPVLAAGGRKGLKALRDFVRERAGAGEFHPGPLAAALGFALVGNALLNPYASPYGSVQTGLTPLCLLGLLTFLTAAAAGVPGLPSPRRVALTSALLGALPLLGMAAAVLVWLRLPTPAAGRLQELLLVKDADYAVFHARGFRSLALVTFPVGTLLFGGLAVGFARRVNRVGDHPGPTP